MSLLTWMQPRDHPAAARTVWTLAAVALGVTILFAPVSPNNAALGTWSYVVAGGTLLFIGVLCWLARSFDEANVLAWALCPFLAVAAIVVLDLLTFDASISAQIFFLFPTLYGASQLRPRGAIVLTVASSIGEAIVVGAQLPVQTAINDAGYVAAALVTTAVLLAVAKEHEAKLVETLRKQASMDPLTGLVTRRVLDEAATSALAGAPSADGTALILMDIDRFKSVNDHYGHPGGDEVLVQIATLLVKGSRSGDVVCRMGGDEVAVLLPGCSSNAARRRAEEIVSDVRAQVFTLQSGDLVSISVSAGVAHAPTDALDLQTLYVAADAALYDAKFSGRDRVGTPLSNGPAPPDLAASA